MLLRHWCMTTCFIKTIVHKMNWGREQRKFFEHVVLIGEKKRKQLQDNNSIG